MSDLQAETAPRNAMIQFCVGCGTQMAAVSAFCATCGTRAASAGQAQAFATSLQNPAAQAAAGPAPMSIWQGWIRYAAAMLVMYAIGWAVNKSAGLAMAGMVLVMFVTPVMGIYMTRSVMRRLIEWHPQYSTLHNVAGAKLGMVFLWPLQMLSLLFKLSINRLL